MAMKMAVWIVKELSFLMKSINSRSDFAISTPGGRNKRTVGIRPDAPL